MTGGKRATILDVARAAGVSRTAVSFAFNNPAQVGADTAERIFAAARDLGYSPNPIARALNAQRTGVVGILVPATIASSFANPFIAAFMQGVGAVCDAHSLSALIVSPLDGSLQEATRRAPVDGYIILGLDEDHDDVEPLRRRQVPLVVVDGRADSASQVNTDDEDGAHAAATHLLAGGHQDILIMTFESLTQRHRDDAFYGVGGRRLAGYSRALSDYGMSLCLDGVVQAQSTVDSGAAAFQAAWDAGRHPTAVLALSDAMAAGVIRQTRKIGVRIPDDLEVIGFDDVPMAELIRPALSTVHQPIVEKGRIAAELLVAALTSRQTVEQIQLPTHLVLRESTR